jgi:hypothetical protein
MVYSREINIKKNKDEMMMKEKKMGVGENEKKSVWETELLLQQYSTRTKC